MLHGQRIAFVCIIDNDSKMVPGLKARIWHHEKLVKRLLRDEVCVMGRKTHELTGWKGKKSWVLTKNLDWRRVGIGTIGSLDDLHLHTDAETVYILGGKSLFKKLQYNVDEIRMYVVNNREGSEPFLKIKTSDWKPMDYHSEKIWSYGHLEKKIIDEDDDFLFD
jgi:dihydrofolate reductase